MQVVGAGAGSILLTRAGRRTLLCCSCLLSSLSLATLGTASWVLQTRPQSWLAQVATTDWTVFTVVLCTVQSTASWLPLTCLLCFAVSFSLGLGPVPWLLMGEILPTTALTWAPSVATVSCYSFIALANWSFPYLEPRLGFYGVFWLFR